MSFALTNGAIAAILANNNPPKPVLQVHQLKQLPSGEGRWRVLVSDGTNISHGLIMTQLNHMVNEQQVAQHAVIRVDEYIVNELQGRRVIIFMGITVLGNPRAQIGSPTVVTDAGAATAAAAPAAAPATTTAAAAPQQAAYNAPPPAAGGAMAAAPPQAPLFPIASLNPYQSRWTIKARVTQKGDVREWHNDRGSGKLFSVDLLDKDGGEIRATMFNEDVDRLFPILEKDRVYFISGGRLKQANRKYTAIRHEYELTFGRDTVVQPCNDTGDINHQQFNFVKMPQIQDAKKDDYVDVIGIVVQVSDLTSVMTRKDNRELAKRAVTLVDETNRSIELTLWGQTAENFSGAEFPVLAVKSARVSDYANRSLSTSMSSQMVLNPQHPRKDELRRWFDAAGGVQNMQFYPLTVAGGGGGDGGGGGASAQVRLFEAVRNEQLGMHEAAYYSAVGTVLNVITDGALYYDACPADSCLKKVSVDISGQWRCEKCAKFYEAPNPRYVLNLTVADASATQWMSMFNDDAEKLLGKPASEVKRLKEEGNEQALKAFFAPIIGKTFKLRVKAKADTYREETRIKHAVVSAQPLNYAEACKGLIQEIEALSV